MINLLSRADKKELRAARRNAVWSRYTFLTIILLVAVNIILGLTFFYIQNQARTYQDIIANNEKLSSVQYSATKVKANNFRKELATAKAILDSETNYSAIIIDIAHSIPSGCVMSTLTLSSQSFNTPQSLSYTCRSSADILRLKSALEKNDKLFGNVNIVSTSTTVSTDSVAYPISITMSLIIKKPVVSTKAGS